MNFGLKLKMGKFCPNPQFGFRFENRTLSKTGSIQQAVDQTRVEPNPTDGRFKVYLGGENAETWSNYSLSDLRGNLIYQVANTGKKRSSVIEGSIPKNLSKGLYLLRIQTPAGEKQVKLVYQ